MQEPTDPFPPRFWWLKRIAVASILLCAGFIALLQYWKVAANRRMADEVTRLHSAGERILVEDFAVATIPDDQNAAVSFLNAGTATTLTRGEDAFVGYFNRDAQIDASTLEQLKQIAEKSANTRALARRARFQNKVAWPITFASPVIMTLLPSLNDQRELTNLLSTDVAYEHAVNHDAETIEILRDKLSQIDRMEEHSPFIISHLVAGGMSAETAEAIRSVSYDLKILPQDSATTQPTSAASKQQVRALIAQLLDERAFNHGFSYCMHGESMQVRDTAVVAGNLLPMRLFNPGPLRPMFMLDALAMMRMMNQIEHAGAMSDYQSAASKMPRILKPSLDRLSMFTLSSRLFSEVMMPSMQRVLLMHFRWLLERRIGAVRLAIRLYQVDHAGAYPMNLEELAPKYIPALPADPFRADGKTFGYIRTPLSIAPVIYSVGEDGIDNGGKVTPQVFDPHDSNEWNRADVFFPLARPPTTQQSIPDED